MKRALALLVLAPLLLAAKPNKAVPASEETTHIVKEGETLAGVANRAVVPRTLIIEANHLKPPYKLHKGQELVIPRRRSHVVKAGETGFGIALEYGVSWREIATASGLDPDAPIKAGSKLVIPTISDTPPPVTPVAQKPVTPAADHPTFGWPAEGAIRRGYTAPGSRRSHPAIDIAGEEGSPVRAIAKGKVAFAAEEPKKYGLIVVIDHGGGWFSAYAKLQKVTVKKGNRVKAGERVGLLGNTGETSATELHFEIRKDTVPVDPLSVLPKRD